MPAPLPASTMARCILHVEDDSLTGALVQALLDEAGFEVDWVSSAHAAIAAAGSRDFDLYLIDLQLPDMDGADLAQALWKSTPDTPVVIVSGDLEQAPEGLPVVAKPFDGCELVTAIERALLASPVA